MASFPSNRKLTSVIKPLNPKCPPASDCGIYTKTFYYNYECGILENILYLARKTVVLHSRILLLKGTHT